MDRTLNGEASVLISRATMKLPRPIQRLLDVLTHDEGQGMVEYALILVLIAVVVIAVLIIVGNQVQNVFCNISGAIGV
jgi:pilus assembly protein Flp/PilA